MTGSHIKSLALILLVCTAVGCQSGMSDSWKFAGNWDVKKLSPWHDDEPAPPEIPSRMVSTWADTVLHKAGEKPVRGFGGRLVFFGQESDEPVRVDGQLVVYAFDESGRELHDTQPTRKFVFPAEQFVRHESESKLGPSYSVWLPWDEVGGEQKNISLIARFEAKNGPLVMGEQTRHLLPGVTIAGSLPDSSKPIDYMQAAAQLRQGPMSSNSLPPSNSGHVQLASAEVETAKVSNDGSAQKKMTTTSIHLPSKWSKKMKIANEL